MPAFGSVAPRTPTATLPLTKQLGTGAESAYELYLGCSRHVRPLRFAALPAMSLPPLAPLLWRDMRAKVEVMGNSKGRDNAKKRASRRKKTERLALAKKKKAEK